MTTTTESFDKIPIYCEANFKIGSVGSVFYEYKIMNCKFLERNFCSFGQFYLVEVLEYPAKKGIKPI